MTTTAPLTRDIGQTENALRAVLATLIADSPFPTYPEYVSMVVVAQAGGSEADAVTHRVADAVRIPSDAAERLLDDLVARGLLIRKGVILGMSETGQSAFTTVRGQVGAATDRMHANISAEDLAITRRTLGSLLEAARQELDSVAP